MVSSAVKDAINVQTYRKRILILKDIFKLRELPEKSICIQAESIIEVMTGNLLESWASRVDTQNCIHCPHQRINRFSLMLMMSKIIITC